MRSSVAAATAAVVLHYDLGHVKALSFTIEASPFSFHTAVIPTQVPKSTADHPVVSHETEPVRRSTPSFSFFTTVCAAYFAVTET